MSKFLFWYYGLNSNAGDTKGVFKFGGMGKTNIQVKGVNKLVA